MENTAQPAPTPSVAGSTPNIAKNLFWDDFRIGLKVLAAGIPIALAVFFADGLWVIYRVVRGWLALREGRPMYADG